MSDGAVRALVVDGREAICSRGGGSGARSRGGSWSVVVSQRATSRASVWSDEERREDAEESGDPGSRIVKPLHDSIVPHVRETARWVPTPSSDPSSLLRSDSDRQVCQNIF